MVVQLWYFTWLLLPHLDWFPYLDGCGRIWSLLVQLYNEGGMPASARTATFNLFTSMDWGSGNPSFASPAPSSLRGDSSTTATSSSSSSSLQGGEADDAGRSSMMPVAVAAPTELLPARPLGGGGEGREPPPEAVPWVEAKVEARAGEDQQQQQEEDGGPVRRRRRRPPGAGGGPVTEGEEGVGGQEGREHTD